MFSYQLYEFRVFHDIELDLLYNSILDEGVIETLVEWEKSVFAQLEKVDSFRYIQSEVNPGQILNHILEEANSESIEIRLLTQHPSSTSTKLIHDYIPTILAGRYLYIITISGDLQKPWLNSKVSIKNLETALAQLMDISVLKEPIKFNVIELFDSELIKCEPTNIGARKQLWKLQI